MQSEQTKRLADVVASALECSVAERAQFLSDVCGADFALREEAESLLRFEENARDFIESPAYEIAAEEIPETVSQAVTEQESVLQNRAIVDFDPELQSPEIDSSDPGEILTEADEPPVASESIFQSEATVDVGSDLQSPEIGRNDSEEILSEVIEAPSTPEPILESGAIEPISAEEPILDSEETAPVITQKAIPESESMEPVIAQELILEKEVVEAAIAQEPLEREVIESVTAQEPILQSEASDSMITEPPVFELEPTESIPAQEPILPSEASDPVMTEQPIFELEVKEPVTARAPVLPRQAIVESGPEFRSTEIERSGHEEPIRTALPEKPKPKDKPVASPPKKGSDSFEIPMVTARDRIPTRSARFIWTRRVAIIAVILVAVAMAIALNSALRSAANARHERDVAETDRARAERINSYLQQILSFSDQNFTSVWPIPQNRNITVTEMLDRVAPRIQKELVDQPDVRGEVLRVIGKTYASQGQHDAAEKNLRAALQTQTALYGEQNAEITETMVDLGILLYRREKFAEAEELLEKGVTFLRKQNETEGGRFNAVKLAHALDRLGAVEFYRGEVKAGRAVLEEALEVATQAQPEARDRPVLTHVKTDLGGLLVLVGELSKGERFLQEALAEARTATKAPQWETGMTLQMLGELALARNHASEAEENFLSAQDIYRKTLGEKNLYFARNLERRATASLLENDLPAAEELGRKSLALTKECSPDNKLPWTDPMMTLSSILLKKGRDAEGEDYLRKTIFICEEQATRNYAAIALAKIRLSQLLLAQKRFTEAENLAFEAHNQTHEHLEPQDPMRKAATNNLIEIYEVQEKHAAARAVK